MGEDEIQNVNNKNRDETEVPQFLHRGVKSIKHDLRMKDIECSGNSV